MGKIIKAIIITGPESSGSAFIAKTIGKAVGLKNWDGYGEAIFSDLRILHQSQPYKTRFQYADYPEYKFYYPQYDRYFVLTTRDVSIVDRSKKNRFKASTYSLIHNRIRSKAILSNIIKQDKFFIWNYETMIYLGKPYFDLLYKFLGIESNYYPKVKDGNRKYLR